MIKNKPLNKVSFILLNIVLVLFSLIFIFANTADVYVVGVLDDAGLRSAYVTRVMDVIFDNLGNETVDAMENIQTDIEQSPEIRSITKKYTDAFVEGIWNDKEFSDINVDISDEVEGLTTFIIDEIKNYITLPAVLENTLTQLIRSKETAAQAAVHLYAQSIYEDLRMQMAPLVKMYYILTSKTFKAVMFIAILLTAMALIATTPVKISKISMPVVSIIIGVSYYILANVVMGHVVFATSNHILGRTASISTTPGYVILGIMAGIAAALFVILAITDIVINKKKAD